MVVMVVSWLVPRMVARASRQGFNAKWKGSLYWAEPPTRTES